MEKVNDTFIVSFSFSDPEAKKGVAVIGKRVKGVATIVNAFEGEEAWDLYQKLITKKEASKDDNT